MTPGLGKVRPGRGCSCLPDRKGAAGVRREPGWAAGKGPAGSDTVSPRSGDLDDLNNGGLKSWNCCLFRGEGAGNGAGVGPGSCLSLTAPALPGRSRRRIHRAPGSRVRSRPIPSPSARNSWNRVPFPAGWTLGSRVCPPVLPEVPRLEPAAGNREGLPRVFGMGKESRPAPWSCSSPWNPCPSQVPPQPSPPPSGRTSPLWSQAGLSR